MSIDGSYHAPVQLMHCRKMLHLNPGALVRMLGLMKRAALVLVVAMAFGTGCGSASLRTANAVALGISTASLAVDWQMTHSAAAQDWEGGYGHREEGNPIMGPNPSTGTVNAYFASSIAINALVWYLMPRRWRSLVPVAVIAVQADTIGANVHANGLGGALGWGPAIGSDR